MRGLWAVGGAHLRQPRRKELPCSASDPASPLGALTGHTEATGSSADPTRPPPTKAMTPSAEESREIT